MRTSTRIATLAGASTLVVGGLSAPQANAAMGETCRTVYAASGAAIGRGCFVGYGDDITVQDLKADGMRVVVKWQTTNLRNGTCHNAMGANNFTVICDYNFPENDYIYIRVCVRKGENGTDQRCSAEAGPISISSGEYA
ncbi:hypothetical protein [Streptomyces sp. NPDC049881]|uniref:hypothetical protein n=1 Tax=Streptomyces sp. NPDC049881 TaxID=3155778 RepID=UPI00342B7D37